MKGRYWDHPAPLAGHSRLKEFSELTLEDVVRSSLRNHEITDNGTALDTHFHAVGRWTEQGNGVKLPMALNQPGFDKPLPIYFNIPIHECPDGDCISPVNEPGNFNPPCAGGAHFRVAAGLHQHFDFDDICQSKSD